MLSAEAFSTDEEPPSIVTATLSLNEKESVSGLSTENTWLSANENESATSLSKESVDISVSEKTFVLVESVCLLIASTVAWSSTENESENTLL